MRIVSAHARDEVLDDKLVRRTIGNWLHYATPAGVWDVSAPANDEAETPPEHWAGNYEFRKGSRRAPLQAHFGDRADNDAPLWGVRLSDRPECWANFKALGGESVPMVASGQVATWTGLWRDADLRLTAAAHKVQKEIVVTGRTGPRRFQFALRLAPGNTFAVVDNCLRVYDRDGAEWLHSPPAWGRDANDEPVSVTMTAGDPVTIRSRTYRTVWVELAQADQDERPLPITIDPTVTISGTAAIEEASLISSVPDGNFGANTNIWAGRTGTDIRRWLVRLLSANLPAGEAASFRLSLYRTPSSGSTVGGTLNAYIVSAANTWIEGTAANNLPEAGSSCWNYAKYNTQAWAGSAGCATSGTDYDADSAPPALAYTAYTSGAEYLATLPLIPSWVESWLAGRANNGIFLREATEADGTYAIWRSSEAPAGSKPYFEIDYIETRDPTSPNYRNQSSPHYDRLRRA